MKNFPIYQTCNPKCTYFPISDNLEWVIGKDGLKHRKEKKEFICGYDGHVIKNWKEKCPLCDKEK